MTAPTPREVHVHDGEWCVACLAQGGRDALEFATRREPLDVEVLTRALLAVSEIEPGALAMADMQNASHYVDQVARSIAAEYARLAEAER